jgi:CheY-like chemotaxis protein
MTDSASQIFKIMLIDDDHFLSDMYSLKFQQAGHSVVVVDSAQSAVDRLRTEQFDAVVLDVVMPQMTGLEALETIRREKLGGDPAVIMLTNQGQEADIEAARARGADGYIIKASVVPSEVVTQVVEIITSRPK